MPEPARRSNYPASRNPDVLYLHPGKAAVDFKGYVEARSASTYMVLPVGVPGMLNLLRERGFRVVGLNVPMETLLDRRFNLALWLAIQRGVRLIAIDLHWYEHAFGALDVARVCKMVHPDVPIVLGGLTSSYYAKAILEDWPDVDFVIRGDGERPLLDLARLVCRGEGPELSDISNLCFRRDGKVVANELGYVATTEDLDALDFVDMDFLVNVEQYYGIQYMSAEQTALAGTAERRGHWLTIGRGCRFACSFCGGGKKSHELIAGRDGIINRSAGRVVDDLERMVEMGIHQVSFNLDPAIMGEAYWSELFGKMRRRGVKIGIYDELFQLPNSEFVQAFVEAADLAHSELAITPLSGSERVRRGNGKQFTNSQLLSLLGQLRGHEVPVFLYFSINLPGEDRKGFKQTLRLAREVCAHYPPHLLRMINMCHTVDPCCPMSRRPERYEIDLEFETFQDYYDYCEATPVLQTGVRIDAWRGYRQVRSKPRALEKMARQWNAFCATQEARCYPVPRTW